MGVQRVDDLPGLLPAQPQAAPAVCRVAKVEHVLHEGAAHHAAVGAGIRGRAEHHGLQGQALLDRGQCVKRDLLGERGRLGVTRSTRRYGLRGRRWRPERGGRRSLRRPPGTGAATVAAAVVRSVAGTRVVTCASIPLHAARMGPFFRTIARGEGDRSRPFRWPEKPIAVEGTEDAAARAGVGASAGARRERPHAASDGNPGIRRVGGLGRRGGAQALLGGGG